MTKKAIVQGVIIIGIFALLMGLIYMIVPSDFNLKPAIKVFDETKFGKVITDFHLSQSEVVHDRTVEKSLRKLNRLLKNNLDSSNYVYKIHIVASDEINAFTLPGGNLVFYTGLLNLAETPEEIAAVMAHEMGHAEKKHLLSRMMKEFGISALAALIFSGNGEVLGEILKTVVSRSFDRDQEREADMFALKLLEKSGIHPRHFVHFFEKLAAENGDMPVGVLSTHPQNAERISLAKAYPLSDSFKEKTIEIPIENFMVEE